MSNNNIHSQNYTCYSDKIDLILRIDAKFRLPKYVMLDRVFEHCKHLSEHVSYCKRGMQPIYGKKTNFFIVKSKDIDWQFTQENKLEIISKRSFEKDKQNQLQYKDVLVNGTGDGTACRSSMWLSESTKAIADGHVTILRANKTIDSEYLFVFLSCKYGIMQLERQIIGSSGQLELYPRHIEKIKIPLIGISKRKKIRQLVTESNALRIDAQKKLKNAKRKFQDATDCKTVTKEKMVVRWSSDFNLIDSVSAGFQTNDFLGSKVFSEGYEMLEKMALLIKGKSPAHSGYGSHDHRILKTQNLTSYGIDWSDNKNAYVPNHFFDAHRCASLCVNDIITSCDAHQDYAIGKTIDIVDNIPEAYSEGILGEQHVIIIRPLGIDPYSLLLFLQSEIGYELIQKQVRGTGQLKTEDLGNILIPKRIKHFECSRDVRLLVTSGLKQNKKSLEKLQKARQILEKQIEQEYMPMLDTKVGRYP